MPASTALKAADKQKIIKKLTAEIKKHYKAAPPKLNHTIFETLLFSACLEDVNYEQAQHAFDCVHNGFFDLNEVRVSSVREIEHVLTDVPDASWKALRIREVLQYVFETYYAFDIEVLKRKTQEAANKELMSIPHLSIFMRDYTIQHALGAHVLPVDESMTRVLKWLGLAATTDSEEKAAEGIKAGIKKAEGQQFCYLLRCVATDEKLQPAFEQYEDVEEDVDPQDASQRLAALIKEPVKRKAAKKSTRKVSKKKPAKKTSARKKKVAKNKPAESVAKTVVKKKKPVKKSAKKKPARKS